MTLDEIRLQIDHVDSQIRSLFIERMGLAEQVAQVKAETEDSIYKPEREKAIIERQSKDMDPHLIMEYRALVKRIMEVSRKYQYGRTLEIRDCFPFDYETQEPVMEDDRTAVLRRDLYIYDFGSRDRVCTEESFSRIAEKMEEGIYLAGAGVIERVGSGVNDDLNSMLMTHHFYISRCRVCRDGENKSKVVLFTPHFVVRPEDNRIKLVFVCPNRSGSLSSIMNMIADYDVNLTEVHSIPFPSENSWNYRFFIELNANMLDDNIRALLFQLHSETESMQILGSYHCEGDF